jgi:hypothetical protein
MLVFWCLKPVRFATNTKPVLSYWGHWYLARCPKPARFEPMHCTLSCARREHVTVTNITSNVFDREERNPHKRADCRQVSFATFPSDTRHSTRAWRRSKYTSDMLY